MNNVLKLVLLVLGIVLICAFLPQALPTLQVICTWLVTPRADHWTPLGTGVYMVCFWGGVGFVSWSVTKLIDWIASNWSRWFHR